MRGEREEARLENRCVCECVFVCAHVGGRGGERERESENKNHPDMSHLLSSTLLRHPHIAFDT